MKVIEWLRIFLIVPFLVDMSVQQCAIDSFKANVTNIIASTEVIDVLQFITINCTYYNCLSRSDTSEHYSSMSVSILYIRSDDPNNTHEVRYNLHCKNSVWELIERQPNALRNNNTRFREDCADHYVGKYTD